jgi:pimeloyl-ACP methyl ester carboxylesterase
MHLGRHRPTDDPLVPPGWADRLESYFTDVTVHFDDDAGHFTPLECAVDFAELVRGFLSAT